MSGEESAGSGAPAEVVPGALAQFFSGSGASPFGWVSLGASLLSGSSLNKSGATGQTDAQSGVSWFQAQNSGGIKKPVLALDNPGSVMVAAGVVVGLVYVIKRFRGK